MDIDDIIQLEDETIVREMELDSGFSILSNRAASSNLQKKGSMRFPLFTPSWNSNTTHKNLNQFYPDISPLGLDPLQSQSSQSQDDIILSSPPSVIHINENKSNISHHDTMTSISFSVEQSFKKIRKDEIMDIFDDGNSVIVKEKENLPKYSDFSHENNIDKISLNSMPLSFNPNNPNYPSSSSQFSLAYSMKEKTPSSPLSILFDSSSSSLPAFSIQSSGKRKHLFNRSDLYNELSNISNLSVFTKKEEAPTSFITMTCLKGKKITCPKKNLAEIESKTDEMIQNDCSLNSTTEIHELLLKIKSESNSDLVTNTESHIKKVETMDLDQPLIPIQQQDGDTLWVNKYAPKKFTELLSSDKTNMEVLQWLISWKNICFPDQVNEHGKSKEEGESGPLKKILLLHGKPGLGKTTLAHMLGQLNGFNIVEINASDERQGSVCRDKIMSAITMNSLNFFEGISNHRKPNMLIIDEIDGAVAGVERDSMVNLLVKLAQTLPNKLKGKAESETDSNPSKKSDIDETDNNNHESEYGEEILQNVPMQKSKSKFPVLNRPIVCICNDPYVSALRPLRNVAHMVHMNPPTILRLHQRLADICDKEGLSYDTRALSRLVDMTDGDVRECLHVLQFFKKKGEKLTLEILHTNSIGLKDIMHGYFHVWERIFRPNSSSVKSTHSLNMNHDATKRLKPSNIRVQTLLSSLGKFNNTMDLEKLIDGCMEHFLLCKSYQNHFSKIHTIYEWLFFKDLVNDHFIKDSGLYYQYVPYVLVMFHILFSSSMNPLVSYPRTFYEASVQSAQSRELLNSFKEALDTSLILYYYSNSVIRLDLVHCLLILLEPPDHCSMASINPQWMKGKDKSWMDGCVDRMLCFGLTYKLESFGKISSALSQGQRDQGFFHLHPPIGHLIVDYQKSTMDLNFTSFEKTTEGQYKGKTKLHSIRQHLSQSLETERIKRRLVKNERQNIGIVEKSLERPLSLKVLSHHETMKENCVIPRNQKIPKDFFGRTLSDEAHGLSKKSSTNSSLYKRDPTLLCYKHREKSSNSVKKSIKIKDFLDLFRNTDTRKTSD